MVFHQSRNIPSDALVGVLFIAKSMALSITEELGTETVELAERFKGSFSLFALIFSSASFSFIIVLANPFQTER